MIKIDLRVWSMSGCSPQHHMTLTSLHKLLAMAQKTVNPLQKLEEQLTCPVCLDLYKSPKILPCHHTFCQDCVGPCPRQLREGKYFLNCPTCSKPAQIPDGGVPAFPPAFTINSFLELHQEMLAKEGAMDCPEHKKPLEAYCEACQELVCFFCATRLHNNHHVRMIADIVNNCKQELEEGTQPVKEQIVILTDAIKKLDSCDDAIALQGEAIEQQIHSQAQEVRNAVDQAERKMIQEVRTAVQQKRTILSLQKQEAQEELARLQSSIEFVEQSMKVQSDQEIVASKTKMLDRMRASISLARKSMLKPLERTDLGYERNEKAVEECKKLGILQFLHLSQKCQATLQPAAPGKKAHCRLSVREKDKSPIPISSSFISFRLSATNSPQPADCTIMETGPGSYEISYTPVIRGPHHLRVMVGGVDIPGSVFSVPVLTPSPETRGQPLHTIKSLSIPFYVAVSRKGQVLISEESTHRISIFSSEFQHIVSVGSNGVRASQFDIAGGIAITEDGRVLVADICNHRIQVLTMEGQFIASVGTKGKGPLQFNFPLSIKVHPNGKVLVSERDSNRIHILNQDFTFSHLFTTHGSPRIEGEGHHGMAVDSQGIVYVTDRRDGCIQKFSVSGQYIGQFGSLGFRKGNLDNPCGIAIDDKDYVYISEPDLQRISIFTSKGKFVRYFHVRGEEEDLEDLPKLYGLAIDKSGNLYACKPASGQVVIF